MSPGAPGGRVRLADVVGQILRSRPRSAHHSLQELEHLLFSPLSLSPSCLSLETRKKREYQDLRKEREWNGVCNYIASKAIAVRLLCQYCSYIPLKSIIVIFVPINFNLVERCYFTKLDISLSSRLLFYKVIYTLNHYIETPIHLIVS